MLRCLFSSLIATILALLIFAGSSMSVGTNAAKMNLHTTRSSPLDLEVGGDLAGLPAGSTRYLTREELLSLPQVSYTVADDSNFTGATQISGVALDELARRLSGEPDSDLVLAICDDLYRANYPHAYTAAHQPVLVLTINGKSPEGWPKYSEGPGMDMGPYLISHPKFTPAFKVLSHSDEAQIPWGVIRLEFRNEKEVFGAIAPRGSHASDEAVQNGYRIAQQNCYRCHNLGDEGGQKAKIPWQVLGVWAAASPDFFTSYVHDPKQKRQRAEMPGNPNYDAATLRALADYFRTFAPQGKP